jgi:SAM-dependent methyltransferase
MSTRNRIRQVAQRTGALPIARRIGLRPALPEDVNWAKIGRLQFDFLVQEGLKPEHYMLDVGCGMLRGGSHFIDYLQAGHYFGIDQLPGSLAAGEAKLEREGITGKRPTLKARSDFTVADLGQSFDFALAQSVFTHLTFNSIERCLARVGPALRPGGRFYATFFPSPGPRLRADSTTVQADDYPIQVHVDKDPYYYDPALFAWLCEGSDLQCEYRGDWGHPRRQHMLVFTKQGAPAS